MFHYNIFDIIIWLITFDNKRNKAKRVQFARSMELLILGDDFLNIFLFKQIGHSNYLFWRISSNRLLS